MTHATRLARVASTAARLATLAAIALGVGCGSSGPQTFEKAAAEATDVLVAQTGKLPAFLARIEGAIAGPDPKEPKKSIVLDPMLDTLTGQQTETTALLERRVVQRMGSNFPQFTFMPFKAQNLTQAQYLLTGTMSRSPGDGANRHVRLNLALTDLKSGIVVAQASALARGDHLDETPSRYYKDSPILIRDKVVEGYARTTETPAGQRADSYYIERVGAASVIQEATALYNQERYHDALGTYRQALATPQGAQLRAESGVYLSSMKLGRTADAEAAFGRIVALGFAYNELGVKFLFAPGSTEFWSDPKISGAYPMWLRQIAREGARLGPLHDRRRPHEQDGRGRCERGGVAPACRLHPQPTRRRAAGARAEGEGRGHGLPAEHRRLRHRRRLRRARPARRLPHRSLRVLR
jgi:hypothetical protein